MPTTMKPAIANGLDHFPESFGNRFGKLFPFPVTPRGFGISGNITAEVFLDLGVRWIAR